MKRSGLILSIALLFSVYYAGAQFVEIEASIPGLVRASSAWGDFDSDGDLDLLLSGTLANGKPHMAVYQNNKARFVERNLGLPSLHRGVASWVDFNGDGKLDILALGEGEQNGIWLQRDGNFELSEVSFSPLKWSDAAVGDYDADGDLDILMAGERMINGKYTTRIYQNSGGRYYDIEADLIGVAYASCHFVDLDNDGDLDVAYGGLDNDADAVLNIYMNENGSFIRSTDVLPTPKGYGSLDFGDVNSDGTADLVISREEFSFVLFNKKGKLIYSNQIIHGLKRSQVSVFDFDIDGDLDVFMMGENSSYSSWMLKNQKNRLVEIKAELPAYTQSNLSWGDYDNDGDPDLFLAGQDEQGKYHSAILQNAKGAAGFKYGTEQFAVTEATLIKSESPSHTLPLEIWLDANGDSDLDIIMKADSATYLFLNREGNFTKASEEDYQISWFDFDNDLDKDLALLVNERGNTFILSIFLFEDEKFEKIQGYDKFNTAVRIGWFDVDNDSDVDLVLHKKNGAVVQTFLNQYSTIQKLYSKNSAPLRPLRSFARVSQNSVNLLWQLSADDQTKSSGLSYNVWLGNSIDVPNVLSPSSSRTNGQLLVPSSGRSVGSNRMTLSHLSPGKYFWGVQAVDPGYKASEFSPTDSFEVVDNLKCVVSNTNNLGYGSLRAAIDCANKNYGSDTIAFNLDGQPPFVFQPLSPFLRLKNAGTVIDARSQPGYYEGLIVLDGSRMLDTHQPEQFFSDTSFIPEVLGVEYEAVAFKPFSYDKEVRTTEYIRTIPLREIDTSALALAPKLKKQTNLYFGINYGLFNQQVQQQFGFSLYYSLGFYVYGINRLNDQMPENHYTLQEVDEARRLSEINGTNYTELDYSTTRHNLNTLSYGLYAGLSKNLFLKAGISRIDGYTWNEYQGEFSDDYLKKSGSSYILDLERVKSSNFQFGMALVFPYVQAEFGYDLLFSSYFIHGGLNFPVRDVSNIFKKEREL